MTGRPDPDVPVDGEPEDRGPRVVVGIDHSTGARAALLFALADAKRRGVPLEVVSAYRPPDYWMDFYAVATYQPDEVSTAAADRAEQFATEVVAESPQPPPEVTVRTVMGAAADVLIHESHGADLLVVGSRGRGGFASMLLGSVSLQCAMHASCPVTVVHSPEAHDERLQLRRRQRHEATSSGAPPLG